MLVVWFFKCVFHFVLSFRSLSRDCFLFFLFNEKHFYLGVHIEQVLFSGTTATPVKSYPINHVSGIFTRRLNMAKQQRRQSVAFKQYEEILKTITKPNNKSPLPVKDRRVGARMKKYRQCFLG